MMNSQFLLHRAPELQRNLWLEFSLARLLIMPAVIGLILLAAYEVNDQETAARAASVIVWILLVLWGTRLAAESFTDEVQGRTWDSQRLSASSATSLILGKLLGGTAYVWYGAALCFAAEIFLSSIQAKDIPSTILGGLLGQTTSLFLAISFRSSSSRQTKGSSRVFGAQLAGILMAGSATSGPILRGLGFGYLASQHRTIPYNGQAFTAGITPPVVEWYGTSFDLIAFQHCLSVLAVLWLVVGAIRLVRRELGYRDGPLAWLAFTVFMVGMVAGFSSPTSIVSEAGSVRNWLIPPVGITLILAYLALVAQPVSALKLRKLGSRLAPRDWQHLWPEVPPWAVSGLFMLLCVLILAITGKGAAMLLAIPGFLLRDVILVYGCRLRFARRSGGVIAVLVFLLYWLGPYVFYFAGAGAPNHADNGSVSLFLPMTHHWYGTLCPWVEAAVALGIFWPIFRKAFRIEPTHAG
jgi:hypothetical protein